MLILSGVTQKVRGQLSALRMELGNRLGLRKPNEFAPLWVVDSSLLEWNGRNGEIPRTDHPFTSPKIDIYLASENKCRKGKANAYDLVLNGNDWWRFY